MKVFKYIVINKSNMKELHHFPTTQRVLDFFFGTNFRNFILSKEEKTIVDWSKMDGVGGDLLFIRSQLRTLIEES